MKKDYIVFYDESEFSTLDFEIRDDIFFHFNINNPKIFYYDYNNKTKILLDDSNLILKFNIINTSSYKKLIKIFSL